MSSNASLPWYWQPVGRAALATTSDEPACLAGGRCWPSHWPPQLTGDEGARSVVRRHRHACIEIEVQDPGVVQDVDRPEDLDWAGYGGC